MKSKTISSIISNKISHWIDNSFEDKNLKEEIKNAIILTGGAITSMLLDEEVNDYDIYFDNKDTAEKVALHYLGMLNDKNIKLGFPNEWLLQGGHNPEEGDNRLYINVASGAKKIVKEWPEDSKYNPLFVSNNAITLQNDIQLIMRFIGDSDEIHKNYDFVHCTNYWTKSEGLVLQKDALESLLTKELIYIGSKYPICSLIRTRKYIERGFTCNAGQYLKMAFQVGELNLKDINVLRDQLVGVDIFYFNKMLAILKKQKEENEDFTIDSSLIFELIDDLF